MPCDSPHAKFPDYFWSSVLHGIIVSGLNHFSAEVFCEIKLCIPDVLWVNKRPVTLSPWWSCLPNLSFVTTWLTIHGKSQPMGTNRGQWLQRVALIELEMNSTHLDFTNGGYKKLPYFKKMLSFYFLKLFLVDFPMSSNKDSLTDFL